MNKAANGRREQRNEDRQGNRRSGLQSYLSRFNSIVPDFRARLCRRLIRTVP